MPNIFSRRLLSSVLTSPGHRRRRRSDRVSAGSEALELRALLSAYGTEQLIDVNPIGDSNPEELTAHDGRLFFSAETASGRELWWTDGTTTMQVKDINVGPGDSDPNQLFSASDGTLYFLADDGINGYGLYATNGTDAGTLRLVSTTGLFGAYGYTEFQEEVFFALDTPGLGRELWKSDGTPGGTELVKDINPGPAGSSPDLVGAALDDKIVFSAITADDDRELWVTDGTEAGTEQVTVLNPNGRGADTALGVWGDDFYFNTGEDIGGETWKSDGTVSGTVRVDELGGFGGMIPLEDVFITGSNGIYASDGGEFDLVVDIGFNNGIASGGLAWFTSWNEDTSQSELWRSDGTIDGTWRLLTEAGAPVGLETGGIAFAEVSGPTQIWVSDGETVSPVTDRAWGAQINWPRNLTAVGNDIYFRAGDGVAGAELFKLAIPPGLNVREVDDIAGEGGPRTEVDTLLGSDWFTVALCTEPTSDVVVDVDLDVADGTQVDRSSLTFTPANWDQPQIVTLVGAGTQSAEENSENAVHLSINEAASADEYDDVEDWEIFVDVSGVPTTEQYTASTAPESPVDIPILFNEFPEVRFADLSQPDIGSVVFSEPDVLTYMPGPGFEGVETFSYQAVLSQQVSAAEVPVANAKFGSAVAISNDVAVVGAPLEKVNGSKSGAAYVLKRSGTTWVQVAKLVGSGSSAGDEFGTSVAIQNRRIVVGSHRDAGEATLSGTAYVFEQDATGEWVEVAILMDPTGRKNDRFGGDVAIDGDTIAVAARLDDNLGTNSGSAFIFERNPGTGDWEFVDRIKADDPSKSAEFGHSISLSGDSLAAGAIKDDEGATDAGAAYVFERDEGGTDDWGQVAKLLAPQPAKKDAFGFDVSISSSSSTLAVGAPLDSVGGKADAGAVFLFEIDDADWVFDRKLVETDAGDFTLAKKDKFGSSVAVEGDTLIIGAPLDDEFATNAGAAYAFQRQGNNWKADDELNKFGPSDAAKQMNFGKALSVANAGGDFLTLVGTPRNPDGGKNAGAVHADYSRVVDIPVEVSVGDRLMAATTVIRIRDERLQHATLAPVVSDAIEAWRQAGATASQLTLLRETKISVRDLPGNTLGLATTLGVTLDVNAAGHGWSVQETGVQSDRIDLLTVVAHEFGHVLGREHTHASDDSTMTEFLATGVRRLPHPDFETLDAVMARFHR